MARSRFGRVILRGRTFYVRYRVNGTEVLKAAGPTRKLAENLLADIQAKIAKEETLGVRTVARASLKETWDAVKASRKARLTTRGFQVQRDHIQAAIDHFGTLPVRDLRARHVEEWLTALAGQGRKGTTLNRYLTSLSSVLTEAVERGLAKENVARRVKKHRVEVREVPYLGEADIRRILAAAPRDLRPLLAILADTGLRRGELLSLEWRDVDLDRGTVLVRHSKTGRGREVPLTARARGAFEHLDAGQGAVPLRGKDLVLAREYKLQRPPVRKKAWGSEFTPRRRVENRLTTQFRRVVRGLGVEGVSLHTLRHSCASRMVMAGVPLSAVARVTGHSTLRCAALYGRHAPVDAAKMAILALEEAGATHGECLPSAPRAPLATPVPPGASSSPPPLAHFPGA